MTWGERKIRWRLGEIAWEEERKGIKVWVNSGRIRNNEAWWSWDEGKEELRNGKGLIRVEGKEKETEKRIRENE